MSAPSSPRMPDSVLRNLSAAVDNADSAPLLPELPDPAGVRTADRRDAPPRRRCRIGLSEPEAAQLLLAHGKNTILVEKPLRWYNILLNAFVHPFNFVLIGLAVISAATGDFDTFTVMLLMVLLSVAIRFAQELKSNSEAESLRKLVRNKACVLRRPASDDPAAARPPQPATQDPDLERGEGMPLTPVGHQALGDDPLFDAILPLADLGFDVADPAVSPASAAERDALVGALLHVAKPQEIMMEDIVPGDVIKLVAGDMVPGDVRLIASKDLFVTQSALTGEAMPVEKLSAFDSLPKSPRSISPSSSSSAVNSMADLEAQSSAARPDAEEPVKEQLLERPDVCFMGTAVVSGTGIAVVVRTGPDTLFGRLAKQLSKKRPVNAFRIGVQRVSHILIRFMVVMSPVVFILNGATTKDWFQAFLFSIAVAVGLVPEMLPMVVNANLAKGAYSMSKKRCIVKQSEAIMNFGAMDILCTDKTGTLTQDKVVLLKHMNIHGVECPRVVQMAYLNSSFQTGLRNLLDVAVTHYLEESAHSPWFRRDLDQLEARVSAGLRVAADRDAAAACDLPGDRDAAAAARADRSQEHIPLQPQEHSSDAGAGAIDQYAHCREAAQTFKGQFACIDEIPFDFVRRRMSVLLKCVAPSSSKLLDHFPPAQHHDAASAHWDEAAASAPAPSDWHDDLDAADDSHAILICKGAFEEMLGICTSIESPDARASVALTPERRQRATALGHRLNREGLRVLAVAYRLCDVTEPGILKVEHEHDMVFLGFIAFLDPPKESTAPALKMLMDKGIEVKVLTGDNEEVCQTICAQVGLPVKGVLTGKQLETIMSRHDTAVDDQILDDPSHSAAGSHDQDGRDLAFPARLVPARLRHLLRRHRPADAGNGPSHDGAVAIQIAAPSSTAPEQTARSQELEHRLEERRRQRRLDRVTRTTTVFAKLTPLQKSEVVSSLRRQGHVVGFLGDGINDAAALREADVGVSVDSAVDVAKESADIILLEKSLLVLAKAVRLGRVTYGNTIKYIKMAASSNFGNVFSVLVASAWLPFLPMTPLQLLTQNLLYDISQIAIPWDRMDEDFLAEPKTWAADDIVWFMVFMGPISSIFDVCTFLVMWYFFGANSEDQQSLFQTAWFVEGLLTQTTIVHMIRTSKMPFVQSMPALPLLLTTLCIMAVGIGLPFSPASDFFGMQPLPPLYFAFLFSFIAGYCVLSQLMKRLFIRIFRNWL